MNDLTCHICTTTVKDDISMVEHIVTNHTEVKAHSNDTLGTPASGKNWTFYTKSYNSIELSGPPPPPPSLPLHDVIAWSVRLFTVLLVQYYAPDS